MNISTGSKEPSQDLQFIESETPDWFRDAFAVSRTEGRVDCAGTSIHYFTWGDSSKPGVVLSHGFMAHARCWAFIAPLLAENFYLTAFDLSGMGDSGWRQKYTVADRVEEAKAVADQLGMFSDGRKPFLVCHSYGGSIGLYAAEEGTLGLYGCAASSGCAQRLGLHERYAGVQVREGVSVLSP